MKAPTLSLSGLRSDFGLGREQVVDNAGRVGDESSAPASLATCITTTTRGMAGIPEGDILVNGAVEEKVLLQHRIVDHRGAG
jgi:hypothetical protein